jgi:hypothetical protein
MQGNKKTTYLWIIWIKKIAALGTGRLISGFVLVVG